MTCSMGLGKLGDPNIMFGRKWRWTAECWDDQGDQILQQCFVKVAARPQIDIDADEINFLNAKSWIPGRSVYDQITFTLWDTNKSDNMKFFQWLALSNVQTIGSFMLRLFDGCGTEMENWRFKDAFVSAVNFGELDYTSSEETTMEVTVKYKIVEYTSLFCPSGNCMFPSEARTISTDTWQMPDEWIVRNKITEFVSPGERILDQFLRHVGAK